MEEDKKQFDKENGEEHGSESGAGIQESEFIPLDDLVYAPLHALAKSNHQLRAQIIDAIKSMAVKKQVGADEILHLDSLNIAFDQVRTEGDDGYSVDNLQMEVPLLSIVPLTNLTVEKAEIDFATEVRAEKKLEDTCSITARICSPDQRDTSFLPKVAYKLEVKSLPAMEGIMRLTDQLSSNQVAKRLDTTPVAVDGKCGNDANKAINGLDVVIGDNNGVPAPAGFTRVEPDLNKGAGGKYIYLCIRRGADNPIQEIQVVHGSSSSVGAPSGFTKIDKDLNKGAGGDYIYLCYR